MKSFRTKDATLRSSRSMFAYLWGSLMRMPLHGFSPWMSASWHLPGFLLACLDRNTLGCAVDLQCLKQITSNRIAADAGQSHHNQFGSMLKGLLIGWYNRQLWNFNTTENHRSDPHYLYGFRVECTHFQDTLHSISSITQNVESILCTILENHAKSINLNCTPKMCHCTPKAI
jgi:hypothetical protein